MTKTQQAARRLKRVAGGRSLLFSFSRFCINQTVEGGWAGKALAVTQGRGEEREEAEKRSRGEVIKQDGRRGRGEDNGGMESAQRRGGSKREIMGGREDRGKSEREREREREREARTETEKAAKPGGARERAVTPKP
jgi:hypothetical protein